MLVDRHHVQYLIELGELARGKSASQLAAHEDRIEAFLGTLGGAASRDAIVAVEARMRRLPEDDRPWSAVRIPEPGTRLAPETGAASSTPPAALLVLGQLDDDPDGEEDGNRLPPRGTPGWGPLHDALERWDTDAILAWVGPLGWQPPSTPLLLDQEAELGAEPTAAPSAVPGPTSPAEAASLAAQEADARSQKTLRVIGTAAAAGGVGALLFGLGRALGRAATTSRTDTAKEPIS